MTAVRYACEFDHSGYAVAARRYVRALAGAGVDVSWQPLVNTRSGRVVVDPADLSRRTQDADPSLLRQLDTTPGVVADATVVHCMPANWPACFDQLGGARRIGQTVWETEHLPTPWRPLIAAADELWVPTGWNADMIRRAGWAKPLHVVPHIVAPDDGTIDPPIDLADDVTVVVAITQWERRKRPDLTVEAFLRAFGADDPAVLVLKTSDRATAWATQSALELNTWWQLTQLLKVRRRPGHVILDTTRWTDQQIAGLIARADCYLSLTASEGWGLGAFDAAAAGVPVVMTGWGGQMEWLPADAPGVVPYTLEPVDHPDRSLFESGMVWARADVDAAARTLRRVHHERHAFDASAAALAAQLQQRFSAVTVGQQMAELLT